MGPGRQYGLSSAQKAEIWRRWKAESRCMRLAVPSEFRGQTDSVSTKRPQANASVLSPRGFLP